ncbi:baseplate J/gp47 family protein [Alcaligenes ammonioxydans]|uniref:baseplate J/gp47 family protein n=1 Tax=Alcaligenes TaxID=507 RepID=UPI001F06ECBF|nr:baseplate J/gp47 family protein [Alcaligenes ammonioxydans]
MQRAGEDLARAGVDGVLRRSDSAVLARVMAAGAFGLYGLLAWQSKQILPDSCDEDMLARWADLKGVPRTPATSAQGAIEATGADGVFVPTGMLWQTRAGVQVRVTQDTLLSGVTRVPVEAIIPGAAGNLAAGTQLVAISPAPGVIDRAVVEAPGLAGGTDLELLERWRRRVVRAFRIQPHGGDPDDYVTWATEVPGITRAWVRRAWLGPGTVGVFVVRDDDDNIVPDAAELAAVLAHIQSKRPVTAEIHVLAPTLLPVHYQIQLFPDGDALRGKVEEALRELHMAEADLGTRLYRTHVAATISNVPGETDHKLLSPAADVVPQPQELPVFGGLTWV